MSRLLLIFLGLGVLATNATATDTAFWKPYEKDSQTLALEHFDVAGGPEGRFGGGYEGPKPFTLFDEKLFVENGLSMEGWIKLSDLPSNRAVVISRKAIKGNASGFELFVDKDRSFGISVIDPTGKQLELKSEPNAVPLAKWVHLGALMGEGCSLFLNGRLVGSQPRQGGIPQIKTDIENGAPVLVAEGFPGVVDELRLHGNINKFWPEPDQGWLENLKTGLKVGQSDVLSPGTTANLYLGFDGNVTPAVNARNAVVSAGNKSIYVGGVLGEAIRGRFDINGILGQATQGAIEFWFRPVGLNNLSDQNKTLMTNSLFSLYLYNSGHGLRPLTVFYKDNEKLNQFGMDKLQSDIYAGRWYHILITWGSGKLDWYLDGQKAGGCEANFASKYLENLCFNGDVLFGDIDELYVYPKALSEAEAKNTYWRYVDASRILKPEPNLANLQYWFLPSSRELYAKIQAVDSDVISKPVRLQIKSKDEQIVYSQDAKFGDSAQRFLLPELNSRDYAINLKIGDIETASQPLKREHFAWEGKELGVTDEVFPPYLPVVARKNKVAVVLREYSMNKFGLWSSVIAKGEELLASPMRMVAIGENGDPLNWKGGVSLLSSKPHNATYLAKSRNAALAIEATSNVEMDGMMKVDLKLLPVDSPVALKRLSIEIPIKNSLAGLLHESTDILRGAYAGKMPEGNGEIWSSIQSLRGPLWLNAFTNYIWMGGPERGVAWFAENDKGWITAKNLDQPLMRITRSGDEVVLRIDIVNIPGVISSPTELTFGVQASPTRPLPTDFRTKALTLPEVGLPVHPWGGLSCAWKSPWMDKWEVVDKVIEGRNGGKVDRKWFEEFQTKYEVPKVYGSHDWVENVVMFAGRQTPLSNPDPVYFEEMFVLPFIPEYQVFQDEWSVERLAEKSRASMNIYQESGGREVNPNTPTNYTKSYQDYSLSLMNEWLKRGVSIYWDNTHLKLTTNPWTSAAYITDDGRLQPATTLWNQREYMRRTWNLINEWRRRGTPRPLEFIAHMTNQNLLPLFTWSTCSYDIEMNQSMYAKGFPDVYPSGQPYQPEFLLTESTGLQVGAYPYLVHSIFEKQTSLPSDAFGPAPGEVEVAQREWGMRMVHEIIRGGPNNYRQAMAQLDKVVYAFGYGSSDVDVWNYWADKAAFTVSNNAVKGILLTRSKDEEMLLVLQSWNKKPIDFSITFHPEVVGFNPGTILYNESRNTSGRLEQGKLNVSFEYPYEMAIYRISKHMRDKGVIFEDNFDRGLNAGWDYISTYSSIDGGEIRLGKNITPWQQAPRLFKQTGLPSFEEGSVSFQFRIEKLPSENCNILNLRFPAEGISINNADWGKSDVEGGILLQVSANLPNGFKWSVSKREGGKVVSLGEAVSGELDLERHSVKVSLLNGQYSVSLDGREILAVSDPLSLIGRGFGISASADPSKSIGALYLDNVVLATDKADYSAVTNEEKVAKTRSAEIVAAEVDKLKSEIYAAFGELSYRPIYVLAMFRNPQADVNQLFQTYSSESNRMRKSVLLKVLCELAKREKEHVDSMLAIGQPPQRLEEFKKAKTQACELMAEQMLKSNNKEVEAEMSHAMEVLKERNQ